MQMYWKKARKNAWKIVILKEGFFAETFPVDKAESAKMKVKGTAGRSR